MNKLFRLFLSMTILAILVGHWTIAKADAIGTVVGGPILTNTTWTKTSSPYHLTSNIDVIAGATLTIEPGVTIKISAAKTIQVHGVLVARGTANQPVVFTSDSSSPKSGNWISIDLSAALPTAVDGVGNYISGSLLQYCVVEYAGYGEKPAVVLASHMIDRCSVRHNLITGISAVGSASTYARVSNNDVFDHSMIGRDGAGINAKYAYVTGNTVHNNSASALGGGNFDGYGGGIYAYNSNVVDNDIYSNTGSYGGGLYVESSTASRNKVHNNLASDIYGSGGGIQSKKSLVSQNTVYNNLVASRYSSARGGGINANAGTVDSNYVFHNRASFSSSYGEAYGGGIYASTSVVISNNTVFGNQAYSTTEAETNSIAGGGIYAIGGTVTKNVISANAVQGKKLRGSGLYTSGDTTVTYNTLSNNASTGNVTGAYYIMETPKSFHYNWFTKNSTTYDVVLGTSSDVDGTQNYWDGTDSAQILDRLYDWYDNTNLGKILFTPYLSNPDANAPLPVTLHLNYLPSIIK